MRAWPAWLLLVAAPLAAQDLPPPLADYYRQVWTTRDGLPHNSINAIAQTPEGYLWFATWEGVARFNGRDFVNFERGPATGLPDSAVRALQLDGSGVLWVGGSRGGLARVEDGRWTGLSPVPGFAVALLPDSRGSLWVGTQNAGVLRIDSDGVRHRWSQVEGLASDSVSSLFESTDGVVWAGTANGLLFMRDGRFTPLEASHPLAGIPILALARHVDGRMLVGTERGLHVADSGDDTGFVRIEEALRDDAISSILADRHGNLWLGTLTRGLYRLSEYGLEHLGVPQGLPNSRVLSLLEDQEGSLWVGTNGGLFRLSDAPFISVTRAKGLSDNYVRAVMEHSDESLWVGTAQGLNRMIESQIERVGMGSALENASVLSLAEVDGGDIWVGTYHAGALRWDGKSVVARLGRAEGLDSNEIRAIEQTPDGALWLGTTQGLSRVHADDVRTYRISDGMPDDYVFSAMVSSRGEVWVGTGVGAGIVEGERVRALDFSAVSDAQAVFDIHEDAAADAVWLVTDRGLIRWRRSDGSMQLVGRDAGLPFDKWFHVVDDGTGNFWLTSNRGVVRIARAQAHAAADAQLSTIDFEVFTESEGMASAQCNGGSQPSATLRTDGSVWVATALGLATVQPQRLSSFAEVVPSVVIESFVVDGDTVDWTKAPVLPPGTSRVEVRFAGLAFRMPDRLRYRYQLEGFDRDWVERGNVSYAAFTSLAPGDYRFRVQAVQAHGVWGDEETTFGFRVQPSIWQHPAFWLLVLASAFLLTGLVINLRLRRHRVNQQRLELLVTQRTVELQDKTEAFERQAREDSLTGLTNRRAFDENLAREFRSAVDKGTPLCLALLDVDRFKSINDRYSHAVGDEVLKAIAAKMRHQCREIDLVSRWGGEEFALLFPNTRPEAARVISERLRESIETMDLEDIAPGLHLTASIGLASHADVADHDRLVARADAALYQAKQTGRNRVVGP